MFKQSLEKSASQAVATANGTVEAAASDIEEGTLKLIR
jgi:hypothetical protein